MPAHAAIGNLTIQWQRLFEWKILYGYVCFLSGMNLATRLTQRWFSGGNSVLYASSATSSC